MPKTRILYVEDTLVDQELTVRRFQRDVPYLEVTLADSLATAKEILQRETIDLVLVDYYLPDGDGISLVRWISRWKKSCATIIITGRNDAQLAITALKSGADDYIVKSSGYLDTLPFVVEKTLERKRERKRLLENTSRILLCGCDELREKDFQAFLVDQAPYIEVTQVNSGNETLRHLACNSFQAVISGAKLLDMNILDLVKGISDTYADLPVIACLQKDEEVFGVQAMKLGAFDCIFESEDQLLRLAYAAERAVTHHRIQAGASALEKSEAGLLVTNRHLQMQNACQQIMLRSKDKLQLMGDICSLIVKIGGYKMAWVGLLEKETKKVRPVASYGDDKGYLDHLDITWNDSVRGRGPTGTSIRTGQPVVVMDISRNPHFGPWREKAKLCGYNGNCALPLKGADNRVFGAITIYSSEKNKLQGEEVERLEAIADNLAFAVNALHSADKRKQAEEAIRQQLKELDSINRFARKIAIDLNLTQVADVCERLFSEAGDVDFFALYIIREGRLILLNEETAFRRSAEEGRANSRLACHVGRYVVSKKRKVYSLAPAHDSRWGNDGVGRPEMRSLAALPLIVDNEIHGVLVLGNKQESDYSTQDSYLETIAGQIAVALKNAQLYEKSVGNAIKLKEKVERLKETQTKVEESKIMLQTVFDGIAEPLFFLDHDLQIKMLNKAASGYLKTDFQEAVGKACYQTSLCRPDLRNKCRVVDFIKTGEKGTIERKGLVESKRIEQVTVYPVQQPVSSFNGAIVRISDVTEKRKMQNALIQSEKLSALGLLVSGMAHEINNPNNFIAFNVPVLREYLQALFAITNDYAEKNPGFELLSLPYDEFQENIFNLLEYIEHGSTRISSTVNQLKGFLGAHKGENSILVNPAEVLERVVELCRSELNKKGVEIDTETTREGQKIVTDPYVLEQVLVNLLINATHAMDKAEPWIKIKLIFRQPNPADVTITVSDNGSGIDKKLQQKVFDPFFTTKEPGVGTGLGLYLCYTLLESIGATIELESKLGTGTVFTIKLRDVLKDDVCGDFIM